MRGKFWVHWVKRCKLGFRGDSHGIFCRYGMGMWIEIQSPRQLWNFP